MAGGQPLPAAQSVFKVPMSTGLSIPGWVVSSITGASPSGHVVVAAGLSAPHAAQQVAEQQNVGRAYATKLSKSLNTNANGTLPPGWLLVGIPGAGPGGAGGGSGAGGGAGAFGGPQGATNAVQRAATGGGADIPRAQTSLQGIAVDVRTEFIGINSFAPDTQISPQEAKYAENVDSITTRGALGKRPGTITTFPNRQGVVNSVAAITAAQLGRSINALPDGFRDSGRTLLALGYDSATDLGKGTVSVGVKRVRTVPVEPLWHPQLDIRRLKPQLTFNSFLAGAIDFDVLAPERFRASGISGGRLGSVNQLVVLASDLGYQLDPDNEDALQASYITSPDFQPWDGQSVNFVDPGGVAGVDRFYTVFIFNKLYQSDPFLFKITPA